MSSVFCLTAESCFPRSAALVWNVTRAARVTLHNRYDLGGCYGPAPFGPDDPRARRMRDTCERVGCMDLFMDVWVHAHAAMHARFRDLEDVVPGATIAYLTTTARSRVADLHRRDRVARGGVAKPQRRDGTVGRIAVSYG